MMKLLQLNRLSSYKFLFLLFVVLFGVTVSPVFAGDAEDVLALVNAHRQANGVVPLCLNGDLNQAAWLQSDYMARTGDFNHNRSDPNDPLRTPGQRISSTGYQGGWGENIAFGYGSANAVFNGWRSSTGHNANMLNGSFTEMGLSAVADSNGRLYWTQVFGNPSNRPPCGGNNPAPNPPPSSPPPSPPSSSSPAPSCPAPSSSNPSSPSLTTTTNSAPQSPTNSAPSPPPPIDHRINYMHAGGAPVAVYCEADGLSVWYYGLGDGSGQYKLGANLAQIGNALSQALASGSHILIAGNGQTTFWALSSNELQVQSPDVREPGKMYDYIFSINQCGTPSVQTTTSNTIMTSASRNTVSISQNGQYVVQAGDNLFRIALRHGVSLDTLANMNNIADATRIYVGQVLQIP